ncbi:MAG TPA: hypothetical protein VK158_00660 [Acidobacteriota bacterium]|nr:hypothetical protein [Acidobacteriota bacterium]
MAKSVENGYWKELPNVLQALREFKIKHNYTSLPSSKVISDLGYSGLIDAVSTYHGGIRHMRTLLGDEQPRADNGALDDFAVVLAQVKEIMAEHALRRVPSQKTLVGLNYKTLAKVIVDKHGGFRTLRTALGEKQVRRDDGLWKQEAYAIEYAKKVMAEKNLSELPPFNQLVKDGHSSLVFAITNHHGGMAEFRKKLGQSDVRVKMGTWKDLEYTIQQANQAKLELATDSLPPAKILIQNGYHSLSVSIQKYHGGYPKFRRLLGENVTKDSADRWDDINYAIGQAKMACETHGWETVPGYAKLLKAKLASLADAISRYHGGFPKFREILRQKTGFTQGKDLVGILEDYAA